MKRATRVLHAAAMLLTVLAASVRAEDTPGLLPHAQDKPPGPALSPAEAIARMKVPEGFSVELVAAEPDLVNPVAMAFDDRGRIWVTESLEYPRNEPGPGRDRIKILEDTDGDGRVDKTTLFADGLNIPSGIAVGRGGVWVANSPDVLLLKDTDGDDKADSREVVVTGFGRDDTHELPNSLTWGPDGWLYGWNGVFNRSLINHQGKTHDFTAAIFRIHPTTRAFELFSEGTSNPWGLTFDADGSAFASACVIDHLWHLAETGYYHRQGGPYPPHTWKIESIVDFKHEKAAYCGISYFDSDAYPPEFSGKLYMGNIHGNAINVDSVTKSGATYRGVNHPNFLEANDAWFMPVAQKMGPDGCLYVLDWYDRYHCYQDAKRDPEGIDRLKGRLYRIRYKDAPRAVKFDLAAETDAQLIDRLASPKLFFREAAQRLLADRDDPESRTRLEALALDGKAPHNARMHAVWTLVSARDGRLGVPTHLALLADADPTARAWAVRAAGNARVVAPEVREAVAKLAADPEPAVALQVAIAARKVEGLDPVPSLVEALGRGDDALIPRIVWRNSLGLDADQSDRFTRELAARRDAGPARVEILARSLQRLLDAQDIRVGAVVDLVADLTAEGRSDDPTIRRTLAILAEAVRSGQIAGTSLGSLRGGLRRLLARLSTRGSADPVGLDAALLAANWGEPEGLAVARAAFGSPQRADGDRLRALQALIAARDPSTLGQVAATLDPAAMSSPALLAGVLAAIGPIEAPEVAAIVLKAYPTLAPNLQPRAIEVLTQRPARAVALLEAIQRKEVAPGVLNLNQLRGLAASKDEPTAALVRSLFGTVRAGRDERREQTINQIKTFLNKTPGDPAAGQVAFRKLCAQCHKIYGEGQEVGPDVTLNGRNSYEQLLSNVLDPSLVIGDGYRGTTVATVDGRVLSGLLVEDSPTRVALKLQGGEVTSIPRAEVEEVKQSPLSLMPEGMEAQFTPKELADLFAFLSLDKPPGDPTARPIPGAR